MKTAPVIAMWLAWALVMTAVVAGVVYLGMNDHPVLAVFLMLAGFSLSVKSGKAAEDGE